MTPAGPEHAEIVVNLSWAFRQYVRTHKIGKAYAGDPGFVLHRSPDTVRAPDLAFVGADRLPGKPKGFVEGPPDLAIEVVSPNDRVQEAQDKAAMWLEAGVKEVWVVWPNTRTISIHRPGGELVTLREQDTLESSEILPGFACPVREVFDQAGA